LGRACYERGDVESAIEHLTTLLETRRDYADVHFMLGVMLERAEDPASAAQSLREALRINPAYTEAMVALASVYESTGDFERSREIAQRAGTLAPQPDGALDATTRGKLANLQAAVADAYAEAGDKREAIEGYRKALDRCPTFHDIRFRLGVTLREAGLPDRALAEFARVLRAQPDYAEARVQRGLTLYTLGRADEALAEWESLLESDPTRDDAKMYLRLVRATGKPR
jgi:tetratricopeptide (TPR) repeat protein